VNVGITCYPTYGGSGIVATELGLELANRGHEVHFITYANPIRLDPGIPRIHYHEVEVSTYPLFQYPPYCLALASRMAEVAEQHSLDLLHVHYAIPHSISAMLAKDMLAPVRRLPFITTLHGTDITLVGTDRSYFPITKFSIEKSDGITSISEYLRRQTVDVFGVRNDIRVITNFVNCDVYKPDREKAMAKCYAPDEGKLLLHVSNFRPVKRVQDCVRILAAVVRRTPAHLLMVGDGPGARTGRGAACFVSGQAEPCGADHPAGARAADAQRSGVVRAGRAGSHGVRGAAGGYARGRRAGVDHRRRGRLPGGGG
jgi:N-acetyl-alpha-D-glucosaminyl L-malate synthase BshA